MYSQYMFTVKFKRIEKLMTKRKDMKANGNFSIVFCLSALILGNSFYVFGLDREFNECKRYYNYSTNDVVALILARGGSKGIHLKNLAKIGSDTLLGRAIKTILASQMFTDVWVSTDHDKIADEAMKFNVHIHIRPAHSADDRTTSIASVQEFLKVHPEVHNVALVQCTSVFLREQYLRKAVQLFQRTEMDCVFSATRSFKLRWNHSQITGQLTPLNFDTEHRPRRQDWRGELIETGMIYVAKDWLLRNGAFQNKRCGFVEVDPDDALEIDSPSHLHLANVLIKLQNIDQKSV